MAYKQVETRIATVLKTAFSGITDTDVAYRSFWLDDAAETAIYPQVNIQVRPNAPVGWHVSERNCDVDVVIRTYWEDDTDCADLVDIYHDIRAHVDTATFSDSSNFHNISVLPVEGGEIQQGNEVAKTNEIVLPLRVTVCVAT